ncbi:dienelactone hydrolase family protein [Foetidibacter luteolus]|uniref:carboxylesterase family protein n=1 Tax=Foetidibacter luteolus TaxID=2608880 RepID=UPI00129ABD62|nr:dienelactone hydrolase family protein [Foetidibacter luteolus]
MINTPACYLVAIILLLASCSKQQAASPEPEPLPTEQYALQAKAVSIGDNIGGFYEALPPDYEGSNKNFPLLLFFHGSGSQGNGTTELDKILRFALPQLIKEKKLPVSFTVDGSAHSFVILMPQFKAWPKPSQANELIDYAVNNYRIEPGRIYLVGTSMGGGLVWDYSSRSADWAKRIAAIVPVCGAATPDADKASVLAENHVPVWAFHNKDDQNIPFQDSQNFISWINGYNPLIPARFTIRDKGGHDAWTLACNPGYKENGLNIYEWMLTFKR